MSLMRDLLDNQTPQNRLGFLKDLFASIITRIDNLDKAGADDIIPVAVDYLEEKYQFKTNDPMNLDILYELLSSWNFKEENVNRNADDDEKDMDEARYFTIQASLLHAINEAQDAVRAERQYDVKMERDMASGLAEQIILLSVSCDQYILYLDSIAQSSKNGSKALLAGQKKEMILEAKRELLDDDKVPLTEKIEKFYEVLNKHRSLLNTENDHLEMTFLKKIVVRFAALVGLMPGTFVYRSLLGATVNEEFMKSVDIKDAITSIKKEEQTGCEQSDLSSGQKNPH